MEMVIDSISSILAKEGCNFGAMPKFKKKEGEGK